MMFEGVRHASHSFVVVSNGAGSEQEAEAGCRSSREGGTHVAASDPTPCLFAPSGHSVEVLCSGYDLRESSGMHAASLARSDQV